MGRGTVSSPRAPHVEKGAIGSVDLANRLALRPAEVAAALGISESALRRVAPELPRVQIGGLFVYPVAALAKWLDAKATEGESATDRTVREILDSIE